MSKTIDIEKYNEVVKELNNHKEIFEKLKEVVNREQTETFNNQERTEALDCILDLFSEGVKSDTEYPLPNGMIKLFKFLGFDVPSEVKITEGNIAYSIKFVSEDEE